MFFRLIPILSQFVAVGRGTTGAPTRPYVRPNVLGDFARVDRRQRFNPATE
jgi:hypothetical protein